MKKPELLSPVGDFECLKAAVQNGADSVYLGASSFNARARATNFDEETLKTAITYAKLRNVKVNLTLNTLIKNEEFDDAVKLAVYAHNIGVDAIIIQDLGLATYLKKHHPEINLHASTQMTVHNLNGVKQLETAGFSRIVLARELNIEQIEYIKQNTSAEIEVFIHGALCISYSGQCLFSSIVGGRSGNRGLCAQPCRLPYDLIDSHKNKIDSGYLLSPRDLCSLNFLPALIRAGVDCFKIEGRLKSPIYVGCVTRIYRKYIDLILENLDLPDAEILKLINLELHKHNENTSLTDFEELLQVFNRGNFSDGHFSKKENRNLVFKERSNNEGIYLGKVFNFNSNKGHISLKLENSLSIGDKIRVENDLYTVSELMINNKNFNTLPANSKVTIGRMKGNIKINNNVYKMENKALNDNITPTFSSDKEIKKVYLFGKIKIKENDPIKFSVWSNDGFYKDLEYSITSTITPVKAISNPITEERIINQLSKTGSTQFEFKNIEVDLDNNLFIPKISLLNDLRRNALTYLQDMVIKKYSHDIKAILPNHDTYYKEKQKSKISLLLNILDEKVNYLTLENIDNLYIPYRFFRNPKFENLLKKMCEKFNIFIYMPIIIKDEDSKFNLKEKIRDIILKFNIKGAIISNISQIDFFKSYKLEMIGNYNLNIYNSHSIEELKQLGITRFTTSVELDKQETSELLNHSSIDTESIVYGKTPLMTNNYCYLGCSNKCYKECAKKCISNEKYSLKDRLGFEFRILPDNTNSTTTIFNSKITSIPYSELNLNYVRIDILDETLEEIKNIISIVKSGKRFEGQEFTNGKIK